MRKIILTLSERRAANAVKSAARTRYAGIAARIDRDRSYRAVMAEVTATVVTVAVDAGAPLAPPVAVGECVTDVSMVEGGKFLATCSCGKLKSRPMAGPSARAQATKHRNAKTVASA